MAGDAVVHVVDDDVAMRESLDFLLGTAGFAVRLFESAPAFLAALPAVGRGCVVTDVRMPEMDGIELLRRIRRSGRALPVIVMTGHGDVPLAVEAMKLGALDFVEKPFEDETLLAAVRAALELNSGAVEAEAALAAVVARVEALSRRERHQPAHRRDLPRQRHDQDAGGQRFRAGPSRHARRHRPALSQIKAADPHCRHAAPTSPVVGQVRQGFRWISADGVVRGSCRSCRR